MSKRPHVLIVEDDEWMAHHHARTLEAEGMSTEHASHALEAINILDKRMANVIILDVLLPGPNAFTLLHELQSHSDLAGIPIILCTNSADQFMNDDLSSYGIYCVLDKTTMHPVDIVAAVRKTLL